MSDESLRKVIGHLVCQTPTVCAGVCASCWDKAEEIQATIAHAVETAVGNLSVAVDEVNFQTARAEDAERKLASAAEALRELWSLYISDNGPRHFADPTDTEAWPVWLKVEALFAAAGAASGEGTP